MLLKLLLQTHKLQFGENGAAAAGLFEARRAAFGFRLTADTEGCLAGRGLRASGVLWGKQGQVRGHAAWRRGLGEVGCEVGRLPCDHREQRVGTERRGAIIDRL